MRRDEAARRPEAAGTGSAQAAERAIVRQDTYERILRLCEAVLWSMARRRAR